MQPVKSASRAGPPGPIEQTQRKNRPAQAREFDMEIERAADNPTLRSMIQSLSIIGQDRRARSVESLLMHPNVGLRRIQDHRDLLAAFRQRDPDLVEQVFRRHATAGIELLLDELD
jgi:DNA-binding FadR family transcriptional regulator